MKSFYTIKIVGMPRPYHLPQEEYDEKVTIIKDSVTGASQEIIFDLKEGNKRAFLRSTAFMVLEQQLTDDDYKELLDRLENP